MSENNIKINNKKQLGSTFLLLCAALIWGASFVAMKSALAVISPPYVLAFRFTIGAIGLAFCLFTQKATFTRKNIVRGILVGLCLFAAFMFQTYGLTFISSGKNALVTTVHVVIVPFIMWFITKKAPTFRSVFAAIVCIAGVVLLSLESSGAQETAKVITLFGHTLSSAQTETVGTVLTLISGFLYALHIAIVNIWSEETPVVPLSFIQFATAAVLAWIAGAITGPFPNITEFSGGVWIALVYVSVFSTLIAFTLQNIGVSNAPPAFAAIILSLESLFGCILGILILHEPFTPLVACGATLIMAAIVVSQYRTKKQIAEEQKASLSSGQDDNHCD